MKTKRFIAWLMTLTMLLPILPVLPASVVSAAPGEPGERSSIGVIRWDAQADDLVSVNGGRFSYYVMGKETRYLSYPQFFKRLPWYAEPSERGRELYAQWVSEGRKITAPNTVSAIQWTAYSQTAEAQYDPGMKIYGAQREVMLQEVQYAVDAGIDYWAYVYYKNWEPNWAGCLGMMGQRAAFLALSGEERQGLRWCPILYPGAHYTIDDENWLIEEMKKDAFMKVLGDRPLIYLCMGGNESETVTTVNSIKNKANAAGLDPYFAAIDVEGSWGSGWSEDIASKVPNLRQVGAEAVGWYALANVSASGTPYATVANGFAATRNSRRTYLNNGGGSDIHIIPNVTVGIDTRPRVRRDLERGSESKFWDDPYWGHTNPDATVSQIETAVYSAFQYNQANMSPTNPNTILMYAWNEFTEGGFSVCPQFNPDDPAHPDTACIDGIRAAVNRAETEIIWPTPAARYTVTFDENGGDTGTIPGKIKTIAGQSAALPVPPSKSGSYFVGWFDTDNATGGSEFTESTPVNADTTVYARWSNNNLFEQPDGSADYVKGLPAVITFNNNGAISIKNGITGDNLSGNFPAHPTESGFIFAGWNTASNGGGDYFGEYTTITGTAITLYAVWVSADNNNYITNGKFGGTSSPTAAGWTLNATGSGGAGVSASTVENDGGDPLPGTNAVKFMDWAVGPLYTGTAVQNLTNLPDGKYDLRFQYQIHSDGSIYAWSASVSGPGFDEAKYNGELLNGWNTWYPHTISDIEIKGGKAAVTFEVSGQHNGNSVHMKIADVQLVFKEIADYVDTGSAALPSTVMLSTSASVPLCGPAEFNIEFSDPVEGFSKNGITVTGGSVSELRGSGTTYKAVIIPDQSGGNVGVTVNPDAAINKSGGFNLQSATLNLQSRKRQYFVIFDPNGGHSTENNAMVPKMVGGGETFINNNNQNNLPYNPAPPNEDYELTGWSLYTNGDRTDYTVGVNVSVTNNLQLVAIWKCRYCGLEYKECTANRCPDCGECIENCDPSTTCPDCGLHHVPTICPECNKCDKLCTLCPDCGKCENVCDPTRCKICGECETVCVICSECNECSTLCVICSECGRCDKFCGICPDCNECDKFCVLCPDCGICEIICDRTWCDKCGNCAKFCGICPECIECDKFCVLCHVSEVCKKLCGVCESAATQNAYCLIRIRGSNQHITLLQGGNEDRWGYMINWWGSGGEWDGISPPRSELNSEYTAGGAYIGDVIKIENVDFGSINPASVTLSVSNGDQSLNPKLGVFVDGEPVAELTGEFTGDWDIGADITAAITAVDITGVKTVEIKYMPDSDAMSSGTVFWISFNKPDIVKPELVRVSATVSNTNLQNNANVTITVEEHYSDGSSAVAASASVKLKQNGTQTVKVGGYDVTVVVNGNNKITECYVGSPPAGGGGSQGGNSQGGGGNSQK